MLTRLSDAHYVMWIEELTEEIERGENLDIAIPQLRLVAENYKQKVDSDFETLFQRVSALEKAYANGEPIGNKP